uniref:NADH dehydrogenase subunit 6 n=1 Tax=Limonia phragmitidis TaxID=2599951 RepID=UPI0011EA06D6|nr:NADH dehydrogenase subunit 6 [Limonia phragmitidis]QDX14947.1 NADH dehydrogenase subunit 6 [Limonia phragmitidis]
MLQFMLIFISFIISFLFMNMKHPLATGMILLIQTFLICLIAGTFMQTFWFSYILFLVFLGGMLVLFIYTTSLASNEMFSMSMKLILLCTSLLLMMFIIMFFMDSTLITTMIHNLEMNINNDSINYINENTINLNKLYNFPTNIITLILINYLFLTLIIIVKITNNFSGPLRNNNH